jgi:hypothetical protein
MNISIEKQQGRGTRVVINALMFQPLKRKKRKEPYVDL